MPSSRIYWHENDVYTVLRYVYDIATRGENGSVLTSDNQESNRALAVAVELRLATFRHGVAIASRRAGFMNSGTDPFT